MIPHPDELEARLRDRLHALPQGLNKIAATDDFGKALVEDLGDALLDLIAHVAAHHIECCESARFVETIIDRLGTIWSIPGVDITHPRFGPKTLAVLESREAARAAS